MATTPQPRNLSIEQQQLVRRNPPPDEVFVVPPPSVPAHVVDVDSLPPKGGAKKFAKRAEAAGYEPVAVVSAGSLLGANGRVGKDISVVSIRCVRDGQVEIAAAWSDGRFDVAFGRRADGSRRMATLLGDVDLWLDHGVEADEHRGPEVEPMTTRQVALLLAGQLGARLVASKVRQSDGSVVYVCPQLANDVQADAHLRDMHGLPGGDLARHEHEHGWARNHVHADRPLGET